ncbi:hypothetical protein BKI52_38535 [marine bacterium AO1-C]|nr:hypothetical protein BKI52_38535 [marine bacterium AO1-C]
MKQYPLHIANQMNETSLIKQRIRMIYQRASSRFRLFNYSYLIMLVILTYSLFVFQNQVDRWLYQPHYEVIHNMNKMQLPKHKEFVHELNSYYMTTPQQSLHLEKGSYAGFGFPKMEQNRFSKFQLLDKNGRVIGTNIKDDQAFFGFKCQIPATGEYTIKAVDFQSNQMVYYISKRQKSKPVDRFLTEQKKERRTIKLKKGISYSFGIVSLSSEEYGTMKLYKGNQVVATNIRKGEGENYAGFGYRCLESGDYTLDVQADEAFTEVNIMANFYNPNTRLK